MNGWGDALDELIELTMPKQAPPHARSVADYCDHVEQARGFRPSERQALSWLRAAEKRGEVDSTFIIEDGKRKAVFWPV